MAKTNGAIAASTASVEQLIRDRLGVEPAFDPTYLRSANSAPCEVPPAPAPIQAVGAPPERYADRITAEMMRHLVAQSAHIRETVREIVLATVNDGSPRGQQRMRKRIDAAGTTLGRSNVRTLLKPGKRGKYEIRFIFWAGWDRDREEEIKVGDPIPERPQIVHWCAKLKGTGNGKRSISYAPMLIISHHVLSRTAQSPWSSQKY